MDMSTHNAPRILVLYTEVAPYVLACLDALVARTGAQVDLVRWPLNAEAPFNIGDHPGITMHDRRTLSEADLLELADRLSPQLCIASGWVDKGYLKVCRELRRRNVPTCMGLDTAWRATAKQRLFMLLSRFWLRRTYSHVWATGLAQRTYAIKLGIPAANVLPGFYAADTRPFLNAAGPAMGSRALRYPHRFIHVARYIPIKGQQELCDAFATLCDQGRAADWELHLVGTGECLEAVKNSTSGGHPRIVHRGFVQAADMPDVLAQAGVSVLPSLYEPWGVVVQEHACMGLPLLVSDAVGAGERFLDGTTNGDRHKAGDVADLQRSLLKMINHSDADLVQMGARSHEMGAAWTPEDWAALCAKTFLTR